jgi:hypothetical protein
MTIRFEDARDVGFFLFAAGCIVVVFANSGVITGGLLIILGASIPMTGRLALKRERASYSR